MLPTDAKERKAIPIYSGFVKYFPLAMAAVAQLSQIANEQHNPGQKLHWAKEKSTDEQDALMRHIVDQALGEVYDAEGVLHATKEAWRGMANLERLLESGVEPFKAQPPLNLGPMHPLREHKTLTEMAREFLPVVTRADAQAAIAAQEHGGPMPRPTKICWDCGADLAEGGHSPFCMLPHGNGGR